MSPRAVVPGDHPGSDAKWRRQVESRLERLFTSVATTLRRNVDDGDFLIEGGGDIKILDDNGMVVWSALDGPARVASARYYSPDLNLPDSWTEVDQYLRFDVPDGYTQAQVMMFTDAGSTFTGNGNYNVGIQPIVSYGTPLAGPARTNGGYLPPNGYAACSVSSTTVETLTGLAGGWIGLWCSAYASAGGPTVVNKSGNYHMVAQVTFTR